MIRWILYAAAAVLLLVAVLAGVGWLLPVAHQASRTIELSRPPEAVFGVITEFSRHPEWRTDVQRVTVDGSGAGAVVVEESGGDRLRLRVEVFEPPSRLRMRIADESLPFGGTWTYTLRPVGGGTELTLVEDGEVYNPVFRFVSRFVLGHHATIDAYLADLRRNLK
jgi:uncharacterized protein YndB with AHSA1/START domain